MIETEETLLRRLSGLTILLWSLVLGAAGIVPLLLYIAFGPSDGNPIGLGLLAAFAVPVGAIGACTGLVKMLIERCIGDRG
ncbi:MAG: hypothetical protein JSS58_04595 [Proteobacteria bacterium]|nr:hypothetical protein [Pseudomonadota bacterium]